MTTEKVENCLTFLRKVDSVFKLTTYVVRRELQLNLPAGFFLFTKAYVFMLLICSGTFSISSVFVSKYHYFGNLKKL